MPTVHKLPGKNQFGLVQFIVHCGLCWCVCVAVKGCMLCQHLPAMQSGARRRRRSATVLQGVKEAMDCQSESNPAAWHFVCRASNGAGLSCLSFSRLSMARSSGCLSDCLWLGDTHLARIDTACCRSEPSLTHICASSTQEGNLRLPPDTRNSSQRRQVAIAHSSDQAPLACLPLPVTGAPNANVLSLNGLPLNGQSTQG